MSVLSKTGTCFICGKATWPAFSMTCSDECDQELHILQHEWAEQEDRREFVARALSFIESRDGAQSVVDAGLPLSAEDGAATGDRISDVLQAIIDYLEACYQDEDPAIDPRPRRGDDPDLDQMIDRARSLAAEN